MIMFYIYLYFCKKKYMETHQHLQELIETLVSCRKLEAPQKNKMQIDKEFVAKLLSAANRLLRERQPLVCPQCGSTRYWRNGRYRQYYYRYKCANCGKKFTDMTGTPIYYLHKLPEAFAFLLECFFDGVPVRKAGTLLKVNKNTVLRWRHKFGIALADSASPSKKRMLEMLHFEQKISLKGSRHEKGKVYESQRRRVITLNGATYFSSLFVTDREGTETIYMPSIDTVECADALVSKVVGSTKRRTPILLVGESCCRERKSFESFREVLCERRKNLLMGRDGRAERNVWQNFNEVETFFNVYRYWAQNFRGVATKYQQIYFDIYRYKVGSLCLINPIENLLFKILKNKTNMLIYNYLHRLVLEE